MEFQIHDLKSNRNVFRTLIIVETIVVCYFQWQLKNRSSERIVSNGVILRFSGWLYFGGRGGSGCSVQRAGLYELYKGAK